MEYNEIAQMIIRYNEPKYNFSKLAEELFELGEVCMKMINKKPDKQPPKGKLIEEMGDVLLRCKVICLQENIAVGVNERVLAKGNQLYNYMIEGKYKGGI